VPAWTAFIQYQVMSLTCFCSADGMNERCSSAISNPASHSSWRRSCGPFSALTRAGLTTMISVKSCIQRLIHRLGAHTLASIATAPTTRSCQDDD
jgi:hypothetical protein